MRTVSMPAAVAAVVTTLAVSVPATALMAGDQHPDTFDGTTPSLSVQPLSFVTGASIDNAGNTSFCPESGANFNIPVQISWTGSDATSGLDHYEVWGFGYEFEGFGKVVADAASQNFRDGADNYEGDCGGEQELGEGDYFVVARDNRGNMSASNLTDMHDVSVYEENGLSVAKSGTWTTAHCACFNNGTTAYSTTPGDSRTYTVKTTKPAQAVAIVAEKNANRGPMKISVDGGSGSTVDTYAASPTHRVIVWQKSLSVGTHKVKVTNAGTAARPRVDVDAVLVTDGVRSPLTGVPQQ